MYPGDTLQKRIARFYAHVYALRLVEPKAAQHFLCSHEGGDISTLRGLGVPDNQMFGYDLDREALESAAAKHDFPIARLQHGDIDRMWRTIPLTRNVHIFLDFCAPISSSTIHTALRCWNRLPKGGVLSATFLKGRENDKEREQLNALKREFWEATPGQRRAHILHKNLPTACFLGTIEYQSHRKDSPGSPMVICQFRRQQTGPNYGAIVLDETRARETMSRIIQEYDAKHAALLLNTTPRHIAAWKAVATRSRA